MATPDIWNKYIYERNKYWAQVLHSRGPIKKDARTALQKRLDLLNSGISVVSEKLRNLEERFGNRILNIENYILDKEIHRILPNLAVASTDIKLSTYKGYNIPVLEIRDDSYFDDTILDTLNEIYYCELELFFLIKYKGVFYKYSNTKLSPLDYILSDVKKWPNRFDFILLATDDYNYFYFTEDSERMFVKFSKDYRWKEDVNLLVDNSKCEVCTEYHDSLIEKIPLSAEIYGELTKKIVNKNKGKVHEFKLNGKTYSITFSMGENGRGEILPNIEIATDGKQFFSGNCYIDYIDADIEIIKFIKSMICGRSE